MASERERRLVESWSTNADAWTRSVREKLIASRKAGTDAAITDMLLKLPKGRLLDVGCGEGWLSRLAAEQGWQVTGVDVSPELIQRANEYPDAKFEVVEYGELHRYRREFDAIVSNFSILGEDIVPLLTSIRDALKPEGSLLIQTVHPWAACGEGPYRDEWREETFQGWQTKFDAAMPWFFRTLSSWVRDLTSSGLHIEEIQEPVDPSSGRPLSLLIRTKASNQTESGDPAR